MAIEKRRKINPTPPKKTNKGEGVAAAADKRKEVSLSNKKVEAQTIDPQKEMMRGMKEIPEDQINFKSRDEVIQAYLFLVQIIAANIIGSGKIPGNLSFDDLMSYGISGLVKAWENFKPRRGSSFKAYASYRIRGEILDKIRKEWKYQNPGGYKSVNKTRVETKVAQAALDTKGSGLVEGEQGMRTMAVNSAVAYLLSFEDNQGSDVMESTPDLDETVVNQIDFSEGKKALWDAVKSLDDDEKKIIKLFYIDDKTQKEISDELGYSKSKISRMHASVLNKLRVRLQRKLGYAN